MSKEFLDVHNTEWDAREYFVKELMYRIHLVLSSDFKNPNEWFERLQDYYDFAACCLNTSSYEKDIKEIDSLLYDRKDKKKGAYTEGERKTRKTHAYSKMRILFRNIQKELLKNGVLMPITEKRDPNRALGKFRQ